MREYTITETTIDQIIGVAAAAAGAYKDPNDGKKKVNLWIAGIAHPASRSATPSNAATRLGRSKHSRSGFFQQHGWIVLARK
jgi:hypothetical protein